jgi:hypothetical protein
MRIFLGTGKLSRVRAKDRVILHLKGSVFVFVFVFVLYCSSRVVAVAGVCVCPAS